jgi:hypothetical protein
MKAFIALISLLLSVPLSGAWSVSAWAKIDAPPLDYVAVPDDFLMPRGMNMGSGDAHKSSRLPSK